MYAGQSSESARIVQNMLVEGLTLNFSVFNIVFFEHYSIIEHIWSESKYDNFDIPNILKTDPDSPKRALSDRAMG